MQEKLQMQMEIKLKNSPAHTHFCVCVCVCVWQADFQHVGKQFGDMIERWVHLPRIEAALACRILAAAAAVASSKMFDMIIAEAAAAAATRTQWRRHIVRAWEDGKNCWGCKWCHGLTHVICLAIFGEAAGAGVWPGGAGQGLGGAHKQDKTFDLLLTWTTGSNNGTRPCYVEGGRADRKRNYLCQCVCPTTNERCCKEWVNGGGEGQHEKCQLWHKHALKICWPKQEQHRQTCMETGDWRVDKTMPTKRCYTWKMSTQLAAKQKIIFLAGKCEGKLCAVIIAKFACLPGINLRKYLPWIKNCFFAFPASLPLAL